MQNRLGFPMQNSQHPFTFPAWYRKFETKPLRFQSHAFAPVHPENSKSCQWGFPAIRAHIASDKPGLSWWPRQSRGGTITVDSKETMYSTLLMRAKVTLVFYCRRHEEFIPVCRNVSVGQEREWQKKLEGKRKRKPTQVDDAVKFSRLYN